LSEGRGMEHGGLYFKKIGVDWLVVLGRSGGKLTSRKKILVTPL